MILEALKGLAAIPEIAKELRTIGKKLDEKQAMERLAEKRHLVDDLINAAKRVPESEADGGDRPDGAA